MTTLVRRKKEVPPPVKEVTRRRATTEGGNGQPPVRMEDVQRDLGDPPTSYGVDPAGAKAALEAFLRLDKGTDKPFCTCGHGGGFGFDSQIGIYVHATPKCWKPSKGMYEAALRAGLLGELPLQDA